MQDTPLSTFQATAPNSLLSVGLLLVSVLTNVLVPAVNDGPSPLNCQPRLLLSPPPTHTFQRLPTPTTIAPTPRDIISTAMGVLWISCAVAVLTAAYGIAGVQKVLYGGSPAPWPPPPSGRNPFPSPIQEGSEWVEDEEEEENDEDPAGDGPPPPPPDPPAKVEESPKLPRRRLPLWVIWLICVIIITSTGVILIRHLGGVMSSIPRKKTASDPDVITPEPRVPTPPQCPRPLLSLPRPPQSPPPSPPPSHSSLMPSALFRVVDILRRENFPLLATLVERSATNRPPVSLYRWVADLLYQTIGVFLSVGDSVQRAVLDLLKGWVMDMVALCIIFSVWFGSDRAGTVVEDIMEEHTLVAEDPSVKKGILPSPRRDSAGRPAVLPPCPAPEPSTIDICDPLRYTNMGRTPALQVSEMTNDTAPSVQLEEAYTAATTQSPEANDEDGIEVMKTQIPRSFQLVQTAARATEIPPGPQDIPGSPEPIPHPALTSVTFTAPVATSGVYDMWQPRTSAGSQSQDSLDNASLDVLGREDNTQDSFGSVVERVNVVGTAMEDGDRGSTLDVSQPLNNAAPLRGALGRDFTSVEPRAVIQTRQSSTDLVHLPEKPMGDASMEAQEKEACSTREVDVIEVVSRNRSLLDQSLHHRPPPARWSVYDLYEPLAGPSRPPNNSIDEASLEVQGRGVDGSREVSLTDGVEVLPQNHSPLQRSLPRLSPENWANQSGSSQEQQRRLDAPIGFKEEASGEHPPALATPVVASSSIPIRTGIPRASATIRRPLPRSPSVAVPPPAQVPPVDEVLETSGAVGLSQNHIQHIPCRVSTVGSAELGSSNPSGRRNIRAPVVHRSQVTEDTGARVVPVVVSPSLPVTSGIPRTFATSQRLSQPRSSVAPPLYPQPPPPPTIPTAPVTRRRVPTLPNAISSPRRANATLAHPPTAPASITPAEASLPLSDGSFDNVLLIDGSLPPSTESSLADQWDQRLVEASLPGSIENDSDIWAPTEHAEAAWRLRESRPALKLITASGFSLDINLDTMNL